MKESGGSSPIDIGSLNGMVNDVGSMLTTIGVAIVMVGILILGIKYMMASPEEAAKIKGQLVGLSVSAVVIFGALGIWNFVKGILESSLG